MRNDKWKIYLHSLGIVPAPNGRGETGLPGAGLGVIRKGSLIAQHRSRRDLCRAADVTTSPDNGVLDLGTGAYPCMRPDHGVFHPRSLFQIAAGAEDGVNDLGAWLDRAVATDHR